MIVLELLRDKPKYVYEISSMMKKISRGKFSVSVLYPVLYRLEELGYVVDAGSEVVKSRLRNYYSITPTGAAYLDGIRDEYFDMTDVANLFLKRNDNDDKQPGS